MWSHSVRDLIFQVSDRKGDWEGLSGSNSEFLPVVALSLSCFLAVKASVEMLLIWAWVRAGMLNQGCCLPSTQILGTLAWVEANKLSWGQKGQVGVTLCRKVSECPLQEDRMFKMLLTRKQTAQTTGSKPSFYSLAGLLCFGGFYEIFFNVLFERNPEKQNTLFWKCWNELFWNFCISFWLIRNFVLFLLNSVIIKKQL